MHPGAAPFDPASPSPASAPSLAEQLLLHAPFVRSLARALVRDGADADDLAQDSLLAALEKPPRHGSLRAWLVGVVRHRALHSSRTERRRIAREAFVAAPPAPVSPRESSERLELFARLVSAVQQLDEPYRSTVLRRFFDDVPASAIAAEQQLSVETVRTRLKRARERLRGALDETSGGRASWSALLLPWITPVPTVATTASLVGAYAVSTPLKFLLAAAAVVATTSAVLWSTGATKSDDAATASHSTHAHSPTGRDAASGVPPAAADASDSHDSPEARRDHDATAALPPVDPLATWIVRGHVHGANQQPRPHSHVHAKLWDGLERIGSARVDQRLVADELGRFEWPLRPPTGAVTLRLLADEPDCTQFADECTLFAGDAAPQNVNLACYPIDGEIAGVVLGPDGAPARDATVSVQWKSIECDEHGEFTAAAPTAFGETQVIGWAPGCAEAMVEVRPGPRGHPSRVEIHLQPGLAVRGRITDELGLAITGATVTTFGARLTKGVSDAHGDYLLDHLSTTEAELELFARAPGFAQAIGKVARGGRESRLDFVLRRGARIGGIVLAPDGRPARGATIALGLDRYAYDKLDAIAHEDGRFTIAGAVPGPSKFYVDWPGAAPLCEPVDVPADGAERDDLVLRLKPTHFLAGRIVDSDGAPIAKASLALESSEGADETYAESDAHGDFRAEPLPEGPLALRVYAAGFANRRETGVAVDRGDLTLVLERAGTLAGRVVDGVTGAPIPHFKIRFVRATLSAGEEAATGFLATWLTSGRTYDSADGSFDVGRDLTTRVGSVLGVEASAEGYSPTVADHVVLSTDPDPAALKLELWRGSALEGVVVDVRDGAPIEGAIVQFGSDAMPFESRFDSHASARPVTRSDAQGRFRIERVSVGRCRLRVEHPDFVRTDDGPIEIPRGGNVAPRTIRLDAGGTVEGLVLDVTGRPIADTSVRGLSLPSPGSAPSREPIECTYVNTDAEGRFTLHHLPAGRMQFALLEANGVFSVSVISREVAVESGATTPVRLAPEGRATVRGRIRAAGLPKTEGAPTVFVVDLATTDGVVQRQGFVRDGAFEIAGVVAGNYKATIRGLGVHGESGWSGALDLIVAEDGIADVTIDVAPNR